MCALNTWYKVRFDEEKIYREVEPLGQDNWSDSLYWKDIIRVCFVPGDSWMYEPDELYIFTSKREESYLIPLEADGAAELWGEIIDRGLFDAKLAIAVMTETEGLFCWPKEKE